MNSPRGRNRALLAGLSLAIWAPQPAAAQHPWPVTPFAESHEITGTFCEYRDTGTAPHFHNGVDIPKPDGSPVYAVKNGRITSIGRSGDNAFVRVDDLAYVHIRPSLSLGIGDEVTASVTVLGTIIAGMGHVHFTDGFVSSERNALRQNGGLTPYDDPWPPRIQDIRISRFGTGRRFQDLNLSGPIRITFRVREANGPPGTRESRLNNGAYRVGYQILSRDRATLAYEPAPVGVQFQFDTKPSNAYVHNVFDPALSSTSSHVYIVTNRLTAAAALDANQIDVGDYALRLFAEDTRQNRADVYLDITISRRDYLPPAPPTLASVQVQGSTPVLRFRGSADADLAGFRLFTSTNNVSWTRLRDETSLPATLEQTTAAVPADKQVYFYMTAVDTASPPNESERSDVYGAGLGPKSQHILLVDGFDRTQSSGSWHQPWHWFAYLYGVSIAANKFTFATCDNDALLAGEVRLQDYDAALWLLGDESTDDETFSAAEQQLVRAYLESGGNLFVSGSEIAWDLEGASTAGRSDTDFLHDYLKIAYRGDDAGTLTATGLPGTIFEDLHSFGYGAVPYPEDFPDYFAPVGGSELVMKYGNGRGAAVTYSGPFGESAVPGRLVVLGFPFETISTSGIRNRLMRDVFTFFFAGGETAVGAQAAGVPDAFILRQNTPNPFAPGSGVPGQKSGRTAITFGLPAQAQVTFHLYDLLGREVRRWPQQAYGRGFHTLLWDGKNSAGLPAAAGTYFLEMRAIPRAAGRLGRTVRTIKLAVLR